MTGGRGRHWRPRMVRAWCERDERTETSVVPVSVEQDAPQDRGRRRAVRNARFQVRPIVKPRRVAEAADNAWLRHGGGATRVTGSDRRALSPCALDRPELQRADEVRRQLGRRE